MAICLVPWTPGLLQPLSLVISLLGPSAFLISVFFLGNRIDPRALTTSSMWWTFHCLSSPTLELMNLGVRQAWGEISTLLHSTCETFFSGLEPFRILKVRRIFISKLRSRSPGALMSVLPSFLVAESWFVAEYFTARLWQHFSASPSASCHYVLASERHAEASKGKPFLCFPLPFSRSHMWWLSFISHSGSWGDLESRSQMLELARQKDIWLGLQRDCKTTITDLNCLHFI